MLRHPFQELPAVITPPSGWAEQFDRED